MRRRSLLVALAGVGSLGGCLSGPSDDADTTTTTPATTTATTTTPTRTTTPAPPDIGRPGPGSCPPRDGIDRYVCYDDVTPDETPVLLAPSTEAISLPTGSLTVTLQNDSSVPVSANFYGWRLEKLVDGDWYFVEPDYWPEPLMTLPPGEAHDWAVSVDNSRLNEPLRPGPSDDETVDLVALGGGTYAFSVTGWFDGTDRRLSFGTRFELAGDPLSLTPTDGVHAERDGDTVVVRPESGGSGDETTVVLERVEGSQETRQYVTEQVFRVTPLRNTLAFVEPGVNRVRLEGVFDNTPRFNPLETTYVWYEGETFRIGPPEE